MERTEIENRIRAAIEILKLNDEETIVDGNERAVGHKLACYIAPLFNDWDVDYEYTRTGLDDDVKRDFNEKIRSPDIIIHKRKKTELSKNLVIIEVKIKNKPSKSDIEKLTDFTRLPRGDKRKFQYQYGLSISFKPNGQFIWFENGERTNQKQFDL